MALRPTQIYVSWKTLKSLKIIARSEGPDVTADEVGDRLLSGLIAEKYPTLAAMQKQIDAIEEQMIEAIRK